MQFCGRVPPSEKGPEGISIPEKTDDTLINNFNNPPSRARTTGRNFTFLQVKQGNFLINERKESQKKRVRNQTCADQTPAGISVHIHNRGKTDPEK
jgi:hypothetical protein